MKTQMTANYSQQDKKDISKALKDFYISKDKIFLSETEAYYLSKFNELKLPAFAIIKALKNLQDRFKYSIQWSEIEKEIRECIQSQNSTHNKQYNYNQDDYKNTKKMFEDIKQKHGVPQEKSLFGSLSFVKLEKVEGTNFHKPTPQPILKQIASDMEYWCENGKLMQQSENVDDIEERNDSL